jgi:hypothetical protein
MYKDIMRALRGLVYLSQFTANTQLSGRMLKESAATIDQLAHLVLGDLPQDFIHK